VPALADTVVQPGDEIVVLSEEEDEAGLLGLFAV